MEALFPKPLLWCLSAFTSELHHWIEWIQQPDEAPCSIPLKDMWSYTSLTFFISTFCGQPAPLNPWLLYLKSPCWNVILYCTKKIFESFWCKDEDQKFQCSQFLSSKSSSDDKTTFLLDNKTTYDDLWFPSAFSGWLKLSIGVSLSYTGTRKTWQEEWAGRGKIQRSNVDLCAAQHWRACSRRETLWRGAGGTPPDIPPLWSECWAPWPGDWAPGSYLSKPPASTAPRSRVPAPTTTENFGHNKYFSPLNIADSQKYFYL